ncbi:MAG: hypothetical protein HYX87_05560 [Chloroflexi bacterium]|nr:hypothetical protein [Chloroflexota bacterium]
MVPATEEKSRYERAFQAYLMLPSESYEFIARTMAMRGWLEQAYGVLLRNPNLSASEIHEAWRPVFDRVYDNLFAMFLQPYRLLMFPMDYLKRPLEAMTSRAFADAYMDGIRLWSETQSKLTGVVVDAFDAFTSDGRELDRSRDESITSQLMSLTPLNLFKRVADEGTRAYLEMVEQFTRRLGKNEFALPKSLLSSIQATATSYPKAMRLGRKYETMFRDIWEKATRRFAEEVKKKPVQIEFRAFYRTYVYIFAKEYGKLMASQGFIEVQNELANVIAEAVASLRKFMEVQLELVPYLPLTTKSETNALEERVHSYKVRSDILERRVRALEQKIESMTVPASSHADGGNGRKHRHQTTSRGEK